MDVRVYEARHNRVPVEPIRLRVPRYLDASLRPRVTNNTVLDNDTAALKDTVLRGVKEAATENKGTGVVGPNN
jgi:hypothetical protein